MGEFISKNWIISILVAFISLLISIVGFFMAQMVDKLNNVDKNIMQLKIDVATLNQKYISREEIEKIVDNRIIIVLTNWSRK